MGLDEALRLKKWMSLSRIGENAEAISGGFFSLGANLYVSTQAYNKNLERDNPLAPFITGVYWAASVAALKWAYLDSDLPATSDTSLATPRKNFCWGLLAPILNCSIRFLKMEIEFLNGPSIQIKVYFYLKSLTSMVLSTYSLKVKINQKSESQLLVFPCKLNRRRKLMYPFR
ncbi:hypothetical protein [Undibacterium sp. YM2]|uniref:hypothetical protein n=1 Tax=Undibacterium sp. YM2 TaxID=2058625 RepID=UPI00138A1614|nr:hypothetical protein [Undibacterium sp. YM2]